MSKDGLADLGKAYEAISAGQEAKPAKKARTYEQFWKEQIDHAAELMVKLSPFNFNTKKEEKAAVDKVSKSLLTRMKETGFDIKAKAVAAGNATIAGAKSIFNSMCSKLKEAVSFIGKKLGLSKQADTAVTATVTAGGAVAAATLGSVTAPSTPTVRRNSSVGRI